MLVVGLDDETVVSISRSFPALVLAPLVLGLLAVALLVPMDVGLRVLEWRHAAETRAFTDRFRVVTVHTNGTTGRVIVERKTGKPLWGEWNVRSTGQPDVVSYFLDRRNVMSIYPRPPAPPRFDITFYGEGEAVKEVWANRGTNAGFMERVLYGDDKPRKEIWFNEGRHFLEYHTNGGTTRAGIVLDGERRRVVFTNENIVIGRQETP
jgi:hypothetical protein